MTFSNALTALKEGFRISRAGWNGKGMYLFHASGGTATWSDGRVACDLLPFIVMKTAQGGCVPWLASQTDILADDWEKAAPVALVA